MTELTLPDRVERVERQNRRLRVGMLAILAVVGALVFMAATEPAAKVVRAERFELVDAKGKVRGLLTLVGDVGPKLLLFGNDDNARAMLRLTPNGNPELCLYDKDGRGGVALMVGDDVNPRLTLRDKAGTLRAEFSGTALELCDTKGRLRAALTLDRRGSPTMGMFDEARKVFWQAP
ncbi:MAG: hypothetical protein JSV65_08940 [Armatimonadota bacterium]|nr:MAG: hypothetical protein JSV65_08940 [Armatimonadota bacterium]